MKNLEILNWMKSTDLVEVEYKQGKDGFAFGIGGAAKPMATNGSAPVRIPSSSSVTVTSPGVGYYRAAGPGKSKAFKAGEQVAKDGSLGFLEAGPKRLDVKSPAAGSISQVLVEEGAVVQYGQPLFVVEGE